MKKLIKYVYIFGLIAMFAGVLLRVTVVKADELETENSTELFTSEQQESIDKANHLTDQDHRNILDASQKLLDSFGEIPETNRATSTDADYDTNTYLTYGIGEEWIDSSTTIQSALNDIYRMILSIRNLLVVLIGGLIVVFVHNSMKKIIQRLTKGGV